MRAAIPVLLLCTTLAPAAGAERFDERIPAQPNGVLEVDLDLGEGLRPDPGSLDVLSHDADEVRVIAETSGWAAWAVDFQLQGEGNRVRLVGNVGGTFAWMFGGPRVEVRVWVPREFALDLRCSAGPLRIEEVAGGVRARTRDAGIELIGAEGPVRLRTSDGPVRVSEVTGDVEIRATQGSIEVSWVTGDVEARTGRGEIEVKHVEGRVAVLSDRGEIELHDVAGPVEARTERGAVFASFLGEPSGILQTQRGPVEVVFPSKAGAELDARSSRGSVEIGAAFELLGDQSESQAIGRINGGGSSLQLFTARGPVRVSGR